MSDLLITYRSTSLWFITSITTGNSHNLTDYKHSKYKVFLLLFMDVKLCVTLREEHRLRVFWNRVLRKIFEPQRE
jgi:hypothetical protein